MPGPEGPDAALPLDAVFGPSRVLSLPARADPALRPWPACPAARGLPTGGPRALRQFRRTGTVARTSFPSEPSGTTATSARRHTIGQP
ncbi:hypothetical protein GCM10023082_11840 [Streptomyces tremellae]|uniref:Uncharacterized protein n=1 Tax=Streptomyces tremellae TaxID=1124239 RepID=A0ABP7E8N3_9ACTN